MKKLNEELLASWLRLSTTISNERIVSGMSFNEALICNILYNNYLNNNEKNITATYLCKKTYMLKSLMNRTLNTLEDKEIIERERSTGDKRQVFIKLNKKNIDIYKEEHAGILDIINEVTEKFGEKKIREIITMFEDVSDVVEEIIEVEKKYD